MMSEYEKKEIYQYDKQITLKEERQEGIKEGKKENSYSIVRSMKKDGVDVDLISKYTRLSVEEVKKL